MQKLMIEATTDLLKAKANYSSVCQLLVSKGGDVLRSALHAIHPPSTLAAVLNDNRRTLQRIRYSVIKPAQWKLLFPVSGTPDSRNFDVTLLTILLSNICGLPSPAAEWNVMPPASDTSISADILRIKIFRNEVYGHIPSAQLDDARFERMWQEISKPLVKLGIPQQDIDKLKETALGPKEETEIQKIEGIEKLKEWKELEDDLVSKSIRVEREVVELRKIVFNAHPSPVTRLSKFDFSGKIDGLCKKFQDGTRKSFFDELSSWYSNEESRVTILTGGPGIGKSVLCAKVCEVYKQRGQLAANHFCDFRNSDYKDPHRILQSLASQMCDNVDGFRDKLTEVLRREHSQDALLDAFYVLLRDPLNALDRREPMLIVVDALDESKSGAKSEFLDLISNAFPELPKWIKILISSRPELQVRKELEHLSPMEILPGDHNRDLEHFIRGCLPNLDEDNVSSLTLMCEGSFLYAYYLVNELKGRKLGIEPNLSDYLPKGIYGFYEKQFRRLRLGLQRFVPDSLVLNRFLNVVAASKEPLPINILLSCMDLSGEKYEIQKVIIDLMSEILPVYDDCLTVYHRSLWDWLTLDGYDEHTFSADVVDGRERLWRTCKSIFSDIHSLRSVSDFQITPVKKYALENGAKYLVNVGDTDDFHWLVHVRLNYLKLQFCNLQNVDFSRILRIHKSTLPDYLYWGIIQHYAIWSFIQPFTMRYQTYSQEKFNNYLHSLSNGLFDFQQKNVSFKDTARVILDETNEIWIEEVSNETTLNFRIFSSAVREVEHNGIALSQDNKLLACLYGCTVEVFELPSLTVILKLEVNELSLSSQFLTFSPDSSYLLYNSVRSCICIREQKELPFIAHGPEKILSCSFSSCGMKLATCREDCIQVWDLRKRSLLVEAKAEFDVHYCLFSKCSSYILVWPLNIDFDDLAILKSTTLEKLDISSICQDTCLTKVECFQSIISPPPSYFDFNIDIRIEHFHFPTGEIVLITNRYCSQPFTWKDRKCVIFSKSSESYVSLVVYDYIYQQVVDEFRINCLPSDTPIKCISKLDEKHFLVCLSNIQLGLSFETSTESTSVTSFVNNADVKCYALSPDNLYVACCYENRILTVRGVDNGETLQTVLLKQPSEACWWSESYLWIVCEGVVVKYPYDSTHINLLGNGLEECLLSFKNVLKFAEGVLVIQLDGNGKISILKICNEKLCLQQIPDLSFGAVLVEISLDGCAVLLYYGSNSKYQFWEIECENRWELCSSGMLQDTDVMNGFCLFRTYNSRMSVWVTDSRFDQSKHNLRLTSIDFSKGVQYVHELPIQYYDFKEVIHVVSDFLIIHEGMRIHFISASDGEIITSIYLGEVGHLSDVSSFYIASRGVLLLVVKDGIKCFKIHNIENKLPFLTKE